MIVIGTDLVEKIIAHSRKEFPNEACGILAGPPLPVDAEGKDRLRRITKIYEMTNVDKSPSSYFMDAREQFKVMKDIRGAGLQILGIYHSHVASQACPSAHDVELAFYPEASYVIVSLADKDNPCIRSFRMIEGKINEEEIRINKDKEG